jgi:hypothetical protein
MAHNVLGIRRFDRPNKQTEGLQGGQNVAEENPIKGVQGLQPTPDWGFLEPEPPTGGEAYTVCYVPCLLFINF